MFSVTNLKELSFLVYGLGLSGQSVVKFFKKNITALNLEKESKKPINNDFESMVLQHTSTEYITCK